MITHYRVNDHSELYKMPGTDNDHDDWAATEAAEDYWDMHDGWEDSWPLTIILVDLDGSESRWEVDQDTKPVFSATEAANEQN
jgi:hypothetical protein